MEPLRSFGKAPVTLPPKTMKELEALREVCQCNIFDWKECARIAELEELPAIAKWIKENSVSYHYGCIFGFVSQHTTPPRNNEATAKSLMEKSSRQTAFIHAD